MKIDLINRPAFSKIFDIVVDDIRITNEGHKIIDASTVTQIIADKDVSYRRRLDKKMVFLVPKTYVRLNQQCRKVKNGNKLRILINKQEITKKYCVMEIEML